MRDHCKAVWMVVVVKVLEYPMDQNLFYEDKECLLIVGKEPELVQEL